jgi:nucleolar protein 56
MKALLLTSVHGIIALNEKNKVVATVYHDISLNDLASNYILMEKGELPPDFKYFIQNLKEKGYSDFEIENPYYKPLFKDLDISDISSVITDDLQHFRELRENLIQLLLDSKISFSAKQLNSRSKILSEIMIKEQFAESITQKDYQIKQAGDSIVDLDKSINILSTRLREWYGLHFPELTDKLIYDHTVYAKLVSELGMRDNFKAEQIKSITSLSDEKIETVEAKAKRSLGGDLSETDIITIKKLAKTVLDQIEYRHDLEKYISEALDSVAPNLKFVLGASITAKLISIAGSLERLAKFSSSTIQILGAEKALFKALKSGGKTPKYGILFQWNKIRGEKAYLRGKIARMVSGKISILAKVDYYKGEFIGDKYKDIIERKIEKIKTQFPRAPKKKDIKPEFQKKSKGKYQGSKPKYQKSGYQKPKYQKSGYQKPKYQKSKNQKSKYQKR